MVSKVTRSMLAVASEKSITDARKAEHQKRVRPRKPSPTRKVRGVSDRLMRGTVSSTAKISIRQTVLPARKDHAKTHNKVAQQRQREQKPASSNSIKECASKKVKQFAVIGTEPEIGRLVRKQYKRNHSRLPISQEYDKRYGAKCQPVIQRKQPQLQPKEKSNVEYTAANDIFLQGQSVQNKKRAVRQEKGRSGRSGPQLCSYPHDSGLFETAAPKQEEKTFPNGGEDSITAQKVVVSANGPRGDIPAPSSVLSAHAHHISPETALSQWIRLSGSCNDYAAIWVDFTNCADEVLGCSQGCFLSGDCDDELLAKHLPAWPFSERRNLSNPSVC